MIKKVLIDYKKFFGYNTKMSFIDINCCDIEEFYNHVAVVIF